ncbi:MAG: MarR family transcriptional regulator [Haloarculaceae archaeon]
MQGEQVRGRARGTAVRIPPDVTSTKTKLVYVYVATRVETTIEEICEALGLRILGVSPLVARLCERGYCEREGDRVRFVAG